MARKDESLLNLLTRLPWWISILLAAASILLLSGHGFFALLAPGLALLFLIAGGVSALESWRRGQMLDSQMSIRTVGGLSWKEFEELVAEMFRRKGYFVLGNPDMGPDGGVDLRLRKDGKKVYVQCKHWKARQVGVKVVRELYGVMTDKGADEGIVVTYGTFTREARDFARGKPISLIDGNKLMGLIREVQKNPIAMSKETISKTCPKCGSEMVLRTARKGAHAGEQFWGCSRFPDCRTILKAVGDD